MIVIFSSNTLEYFLFKKVTIKSNLKLRILKPLDQELRLL